jgi:hypothetical protein
MACVATQVEDGSGIAEVQTGVAQQRFCQEVVDMAVKCFGS